MFVYQVYVLLSNVCISIKVLTSNVCMCVNPVKSYYWYVQMKKSIVLESPSQVFCFLSHLGTVSNNPIRKI